MRKAIAMLLAASIVAVAATPIQAQEKGKVPAVLSFKMKGIDGKDVDLSQYQGKVILFVNVASKCGYTKQYKGLQAIFDKYSKDGFVIIGVPANDFGKQEPGTDDEIAKFCDSKFGVKFPLLAKVSTVKGDDAVPLYKFLTGKQSDPKFAGEIKWNFTKFLVGRNGEIVGRYEPKIEPDSEELTKAIEAELKKK